MNEYHIDLKNIYSADDLHDLLREILPLPDYYGGTLDALYDVLTDEGAKWTIRFTGAADAEAILGKYLRSLKRMCARAVSETGDREITFED